MPHDSAGGYVADTDDAVPAAVRVGDSPVGCKQVVEAQDKSRA